MLWNLLSLLLILILLVYSVSKWKLHPFIALILAAIALGFSLGMGGKQSLEVLLEGFGNTMKWIAIVVILGAFIGEVLSETGAAQRISKAVVKRTGEKKLPWAMGITGYLVSIPVFVDVAYIILQPITEALSVKSKRPVLVLGLALTAGLTVSHTLIPPTPGPLVVASLLKVDLGKMLLINLGVGGLAMAAGILWASKACKNQWLEYDQKLLAQKKEIDTETEHANIPVIMDLLPILVPILLMAAGGFLELEEGSYSQEILAFISTPIIAVLIGAFIAFLQFNRTSGKAEFNRLVEQAIVKSALVIMITAAGGAFGNIIRESGMDASLSDFFISYPALGIMLPFLLAAVLTTATGSITVSLIGTASILGPMASEMSYSPEIMAALIGCGSFCVFHANSSFFWLLNRLHDVPVHILYKTYTPQSAVMGFSGLMLVLCLHFLGLA
ncbi:MAG: GntP family permease [Bacteroidia bacterium]|nr:GntP family permease [Bacteroidia bacterium]